MDTMMRIYDDPVTYIGHIGDHDIVYYSTETNQMYIHDEHSGTTSTYTHEEMTNLEALIPTIKNMV